MQEGKDPGAVKEGKSRQIPDDAGKPADGRVVTGKYAKRTEAEGRKPLPVGISDDVREPSEYYYADKTLLIKELLDRKAYVALFTDIKFDSWEATFQTIGERGFEADR